MRKLAKGATSSLVALCAAFTLVVVAVAVIGILGILSANRQGTVIAGDELTTAVAASQLARDMDAAYTAGDEAAGPAGEAERSRLLGLLIRACCPRSTRSFSGWNSCTSAIPQPKAPTSSCHPAVDRRP